MSVSVLGVVGAGFMGRESPSRSRLPASMRCDMSRPSLRSGAHASSLASHSRERSGEASSVPRTPPGSQTV
jgi:hypothetical protein